MRYIPHTDADIAAMLQAVGISELDELFSTIPTDCRLEGGLNLPEPMTEWELHNLLEALSRSVAVSPEYRVFLGAGSYDHFIPESIHHLLQRGEFVTSYTPYQPELSQGTLQAIYEFQTLTSGLFCPSRGHGRGGCSCLP